MQNDWSVTHPAGESVEGDWSDEGQMERKLLVISRRGRIVVMVSVSGPRMKL